MSTEVIFEDENLAASLLKDVRSDSVETNWVIYEYITGSQNKLRITGSGVGGLEELKSHLDESKRQYAFLRTTDVYDGHQTVKFVFIVWSGEKVSVVQKARMATHKGSITRFIGSAHLTIDASELNDLAEIMSKIADNSGSGSRVLNVGEAPRGHSVLGSKAPTQASLAPTHNQQQQQQQQQQETLSNSSESTSEVHQQQEPVQQQQQQPALPHRATTTRPAIANNASSRPTTAKTSGKLNFSNIEEIKAALSDLRSDATPTDWVLIGYEGQTDVIKLIGSGEGGISALISHLTLDSVAYGLVRTTDIYDGYVTAKFVSVWWIGEEVRLARKARVSTHKGEIQNLIGQYHTDLNASNFNEISEDIMKDRVQFSAGTKNWLKK